jgi:cytosine/adenosine deaminase-related metal-dependent hydrolase
LPLLLLPGLVNAHAHLDLAGTGPLPAGETFPDWLLAVGGVRAAGGDVTDAAQEEAGALACRGVVAVGDIDGSGGAGTRGRRRAALGGRSFLEILGVHREGARARLAASLEQVGALGDGPASLGLSPHAPYSVHSDVLPEIVRAASRRRLPLAMHLAESTEETRFLLRGDGPFTRLLDVIGKGLPFDRPPGLRPVAWAERAGFLAAGGLVVHGNDLDDDDIDLLARHRACVVYCHGTHRHFDRPQHRWLDLARAGVTLALGTDSGASNDGIDLFTEMVRLAADRPDIPPLEILRAATAGGRRALALPDGAVTWEVGSAADGLLLGPLPDQLSSAPPQDLLAWALSGQAQPLATFHAGMPREAPGAPSSLLPGFLDTFRAHG